MVGCKVLRHYKIDHGSKTVVGWTDDSFTIELHHDVCFANKKDSHGIILYYKNNLGDNIQQRLKLRYPDEASKQTMEGYTTLADGDIKLKFMPIKAPTELLFIGLELKVAAVEAAK